MCGGGCVCMGLCVCVRVLCSLAPRNKFRLLAMYRAERSIWPRQRSEQYFYERSSRWPESSLGRQQSAFSLRGFNGFNELTAVDRCCCCGAMAVAAVHRLSRAQHFGFRNLTTPLGIRDPFSRRRNLLPVDSIENYR